MIKINKELTAMELRLMAERLKRSAGNDNINKFEDLLKEELTS